MSKTPNYRIAIIGPRQMVAGFTALGVDVREAVNGAETLAQLREIKRAMNTSATDQHYAVVCVIESMLEGIDMTEYAKVVEGPLPAVVLLPGPEGSTGRALERLRRLAERAVGSAII